GGRPGAKLIAGCSFLGRAARKERTPACRDRHARALVAGALSEGACRARLPDREPFSARLRSRKARPMDGRAWRPNALSHAFRRDAMAESLGQRWRESRKDH